MKKWQFITIILIAVLVIGTTALLRWLRPYDLATEEARARAAGLPLTVAEIGISKPPPDQDAYPLWVALKPALDKSTPREDALYAAIDKNTDANGQLNAAGLSAAVELAGLQAGEDARIREAANRPEMFWPLTYDPTSFSITVAATLRYGAQRMSLSSRRLAAEGRYRESAEAAGVGLNIARQAAAGPTIINYLVAVALNDIALRDMENMLRRAGPNAEAASAVHSVIANHPPAYDLAYAMRGEAVFQLTGLDQAVALGSPIVWVSPGALTGPWSRVAHLRPPLTLWRYISIQPSKAAYLHWLVPMVEAARRPDPVRVPALESVGRRVAALSPENPTLMPARGVLDIQAKAAQRGQQEDARRAVLLAVAEVFDYRVTHGVYPARLTDAAPKPPVDPFTGKPIFYARKGNGFVVRTGTAPPSLFMPAKKLGVEFRYP